MSKTKRRILWVVLNLGTLVAVIWVGFFDGPQAVANLAVAYAWFFLLGTVFTRGLMAVAKFILTRDDDDVVLTQKEREFREKRDEMLGKLGAIELSVPRWLDRTVDWVIGLALVAAGWWVTGVVWFLAIWVQHGLLKTFDFLQGLHKERMEEALGVKL